MAVHPGGWATSTFAMTGATLRIDESKQSGWNGDEVTVRPTGPDVSVEEVDLKRDMLQPDELDVTERW